MRKLLIILYVLSLASCFNKNEETAQIYTIKEGDTWVYVTRREDFNIYFFSPGSMQIDTIRVLSIQRCEDSTVYKTQKVSIDYIWDYMEDWSADTGWIADSNLTINEKRKDTILTIAVENTPASLPVGYNTLFECFAWTEAQDFKIDEILGNEYNVDTIGHTNDFKDYKITKLNDYTLLGLEGIEYNPGFYEEVFCRYTYVPSVGRIEYFEGCWSWSKDVGDSTITKLFSYNNNIYFDDIETNPNRFYTKYMSEKPTID